LKTITLAIFAIAVGATGASAADMAVKARPIAVDPVYNWTGWYIGGNVGYAWGKSDTTTVVDPTSSWAVEQVPFRNEFMALGSQNYSPRGVVGGLQAGYNYQSGAWVFGLEADISAANISRTNLSSGLNNAITRNFTETTKSDWFATVRPRFGYAANTTLLYVTGGLAVGNVSGEWQVLSSNTYNKTGSGSDTKVGWTVGAGVEQAFAPHWTVKLEYLYTDLGSINYTSTYLPGSSFAPPGNNYVERISQDLTFHTVRVGVNYKF